MAYSKTNLSALSYANGFTLWHYRTNDTHIDCQYFTPAKNMVRKGDFLLVNTPQANKMLAVSHVDSVVVLTEEFTSDA
jgi:hypothetical protein